MLSLGSWQSGHATAVVFQRVRVTRWYLPVNNEQAQRAKFKTQSDDYSALTLCLTFVRNNAHLMEYKRFRDNGWPIGNGPVKAVCKNVVKQRM